MSKLIGFCTGGSMYDGPFNSEVGWHAAGMGYIFQNDDGMLIVVDGGNTQDSEPFFELLQKCSGSKKVTVDYWIITHPHNDHYFCLREICNRNDISKLLEVKNLVYHFPNDLEQTMPGCCVRGIRDMEHIAHILGANTVYPHVKEKIFAGRTEIEFLYVFDGKEQVDNGNGLSLIFTITDDQRIMITGDAFKPSLSRVAEEYGERLKSDILQLPHHALCDTGVLEFYKCVDAKTTLLPTCIAGYAAMNEDENYRIHNTANKYAEDNAHIVYKSFEGTFEIQL